MKFYTFNKNVCLELQWDKCSGFSQDLLISFFATNPHFIFEANIQFCFAHSPPSFTFTHLLKPWHKMLSFKQWPYLV